MTATTDAIAEFSESIQYSHLPIEVVERTKKLILDTAGIIVRARNSSESTGSLIRAVDKLGLNQGSCSVFGDTKLYAPSAAALINGTLAHSLDFDDTHAEASLHASAPILPAVLSAAQMQNASGKEIITALVLGYEIHIRLGKAVDAGDHYKRGFHPTATCGIFAAAAAAGKIFGLSKAQFSSAFGVALSQTAGAMQFLVDGAWTKRLHVGQAAQNGLMAAVAASENFKGPGESIEGQWGFLSNYSSSGNPSRATSELGDRWDTMSLGVKPYPSCRYSHAAIDAIIDLTREHSLSECMNPHIHVGLPSRGFGVIGEPIDLKQAPKSIVDAQFSMPFSAAVAFRERRFVWDDYQKHLLDPDTLKLCHRVSVSIDELAEANSPENMSASVSIDINGEKYERFVKVPKGEPTNFMSEGEFIDKFKGLCEPFMTKTELDALVDTILTLETFNDATTKIFNRV